MSTVFIVWHTREIPDQAEDAKLIGVYESREAAELAKKRAIVLPGFDKFPQGFEINEYKFGYDHWTEGFVTVTHPDSWPKG